MRTNEIKAAIRHMYENAPVEDDDRAETTEDVGRQVILELPAALPRKPADDRSVKLPIRVAWNGGSGVVLEVGPYDFNDASVQMLKQAIAFFEHHGGKVVPIGPVANNSPDAAHGAGIASKRRTPEVAE